MKNIKIYKDEFDIRQEDIGNAEKVWETEFPAEYKNFLLKNNGGVPYPSTPILPSENDSELWPIERFLSIGDIVIQKKHPMTYTLHDIDAEDLELHNLDLEYLLVFALGERGIYFLNLDPKDYSQIYFANFSGGDGIIKVETNSFVKFIDSLGIPDWSDDEYDPNFEFKGLHYPDYKIFQYYLFYTPNNPQLGFHRFKEVYKVLGDIQPPEDGYPNIAQKYVDDIQKLDFLLQNGCSTEGLLTSAKQAKTIQYLVEELNLDINKKYKNRYPLQNYLSDGYNPQFQYEVINELLELGIEMDWSIKAKLINGKNDLPMIEKLRILHEKYIVLELEEQEFYKKYNKPSGRPPFIKSNLIERKLGITKKNWINRILKSR